MVSFEEGKRIFEENKLSYSRILHEKLEIYCDFLLEYNKNVNLTAIKEPLEVWQKHFADSILLVENVEIPKKTRLIDIGTGAGFPSVPLKLYRDDLEITLLDSLNKRITFLNLLCDRLDIKAETVHGRAEEAGRNVRFREKFDIACARAVAAMPTLCEYCMPFVKKGGVFAALKGPGENIDDCRNAVKILGGALPKEIEYTLGNMEKRKIFLIKKISQTSTKYPRNSGQIKNKPL